MLVLFWKTLIWLVRGLVYLIIGPIGKTGELYSGAKRPMGWYRSFSKEPVEKLAGKIYAWIAKNKGRLPRPAIFLVGTVLGLAVLATILFAVWQPFLWEKFIATPSPPLTATTSAATLDTRALSTLMILVVALLSLGVAASILLIKLLLERTVRETAQREANEARFRFFHDLSYSYWLLYKPQTPLEKGQPIPAEWAGAVDAGKQAARDALEIATKLGAEKKILSAQNSLAYHIATKCDSDDEGNDALRYGSTINREADKYNEYNWKETYVWVLWRLGIDYFSRQKARQVLDELLDGTELPNSEKDDLRRKYSRMRH